MKKIVKDWEFHFQFDYDPDAYSWDMECDNCFHTNRIWIKKGVKVPLSIKCEDCGCQTKEKQEGK